MDIRNLVHGNEQAFNSNSGGIPLQKIHKKEKQNGLITQTKAHALWGDKGASIS
jgi:hypothetical protein